MINLGKKEKTKSPLGMHLEQNQIIEIGGKSYAVRNWINELWYLHAVNGTHYNDTMFRQLGTSPEVWCEEHDIEPAAQHGIFPYMTKFDLERAVVYLINETNEIKEHDLPW